MKWNVTIEADKAGVAVNLEAADEDDARTKAWEWHEKNLDPEDKREYTITAVTPAKPGAPTV